MIIIPRAAALTAVVLGTGMAFAQPVPTRGVAAPLPPPMDQDAAMQPPPPPAGAPDTDAPPPPGPRGSHGAAPPPPGVAIRVERGPDATLRIDVHCGPRDGAKDCADIASQLVDKMNGAVKDR